MVRRYLSLVTGIRKPQRGSQFLATIHRGEKWVGEKVALTVCFWAGTLCSPVYINRRSRKLGYGVCAAEVDSRRPA